jgi:DNA-binding NarL/FixJ family response regulator
LTGRYLKEPEFNRSSKFHLRKIREGQMRRRQSFGTVLIGKSILIREGICRILRAENFRILASVSCADDFPPCTLQPHQQLFLIIQTGDDFDLAVEQIGLVRDQHPSGRIAIVADQYRPGELALAFRAGVSGYFVDQMTCDAFIKSIELVMMGETIFPPAFPSFPLDLNRDDTRSAPRHKNEQAIRLRTDDTIAPQLSPRETAILHCLIEGDSNKCIARKIDIAEATVKVHVKAILRKIRVQNRTQAAIWGMNNGPLARPENTSVQPSLDTNRRMPKAIDVNVISNIKQIEASGSRESINNNGNHVEVPRVDRLIRKSVNRRGHGAARLAK